LPIPGIERWGSSLRSDQRGRTHKRDNIANVIVQNDVNNVNAAAASATESTVGLPDKLLESLLFHQLPFRTHDVPVGIYLASFW
jgi:hypothetical protein